jgi:hypothetical protein
MHVSPSAAHGAHCAHPLGSASPQALQLRTPDWQLQARVHCVESYGATRQEPVFTHAAPGKQPSPASTGGGGGVGQDVVHARCPVPSQKHVSEQLVGPDEAVPHPELGMQGAPGAQPVPTTGGGHRNSSTHAPSTTTYCDFAIESSGQSSV